MNTVSAHHQRAPAASTARCTRLMAMPVPGAARKRVASAAHAATAGPVTAAMRVEVAPAIASPQVLKPDVPELDPNSFYDFIQESSDSLVVVDWYTDWCGPCQLMHKEVEKLSSAFKNVKFAKLNCSACQEFSTRQRIRALPTFRVYYKGTCLDEVTGAKPVQLRQLLTHYTVMTTIQRTV